jgi:putative salt-induced outer membrane protein YdiY
LRKLVPVVVVSFLVAAVPRLVAAQAPAQKEQPPLVEASTQVAFLATTGNASTSTIGGGADVLWRPDAWTHRFQLNFTQSETDDELSARSLGGRYRASRVVGRRLSLYSQYDYLRDLFAGVEQRHVIEGGLSLIAIDNERQRLQSDLGFGYLAERGPKHAPEEPDPEEDPATAPPKNGSNTLNTATLTAAAAYRARISTTSTFIFEPRFLLTIGEVGAWKYDQVATLTADLTSILALKLAHTVRYSADPPAGFDRTDTITAVSLVMKLRRDRPPPASVNP